MYEVKFYHDRNGKSEIVDYLDGLSEKVKRVRQIESTVIRYLHILEP